MISLGTMRVRARLNRIPSPIFEQPSRRFSSSKGSSSSRARRLVTTAAVTTPGFWLFLSKSDDDDRDKNDATDNVPNLPCSSTGELVNEPAPNKDQVTRMISQDSYSFPVRNIPGVSRYDGAQLASNSPCEDRFIHGKFPSPWKDGRQWMAWGVLDGHAGWQTADLLEKQLLPYVQTNLQAAAISRQPNGTSITEAQIQNAITQAFLQLDDSIVYKAYDNVESAEPLHEKVMKLAPALAGSCALLSIYDSGTSTLHVACTGDSRAVLGQQLPDGSWQATPLSNDQTGSNEAEIARLRKEHPNEKNMVAGGRVLGLMVSRAFGDSRWKWPVNFQEDVKKQFYGPSPLTSRYDVLTPPYITAEPVVTSTKIHPDRPSFLIMGSDGLWDRISNQQGVNLVAEWLAARGPHETGNSLEFTSLSEAIFDSNEDSKTPERLISNHRFVEENTVVEDENVAVHLMRNSLGGSDHELLASRLAINAPFSRSIRDDITVQVAFFNAPGLNNKRKSKL